MTAQPLNRRLVLPGYGWQGQSPYRVNVLRPALAACSYAGRLSMLAGAT
jgi:hypothetical protein